MYLVTKTEMDADAYQTTSINNLGYLNLACKMQAQYCHTKRLSYDLMMMKIIHCFCGMVDRQKAFSLISSRDHCQRSSPSGISKRHEQDWKLRSFYNFHKTF